MQLQAKYELPKGESKLTLLGNEYFQEIRVQSDTLDLHFSGRTHKEKLPVTFTADWITAEGSTTRKTGEQDTVAIDWLLRSQELWQAVTLVISVDTLEIKGVILNGSTGLRRRNSVFHGGPNRPSRCR